MLYQKKVKGLIKGDFNSRSREWGKDTKDIHRVALSQVILIKHLICLNDGRPTRLVSRLGDSDGFIDLTLITSPHDSVEVTTEKDRDHLLSVVLISKNIAKKQIKRENVFRHCIGDRIHDDNNDLQKLKQNARRK